MRSHRWNQTLQQNKGKSVLLYFLSTTVNKLTKLPALLLPTRQLSLSFMLTVNHARDQKLWGTHCGNLALGNDGKNKGSRKQQQNQQHDSSAEYYTTEVRL